MNFILRQRYRPARATASAHRNFDVMSQGGAREAEPRRLMCGVPVRHPELAAAPDLNAKAHL